MREEHDDLALGLVLDSYMTEYHHPGSAAMSAVVTDLTAHRGAGPRRALARSLLLAGYRFGALDLQTDRRNGALPRVVALATGRHVAAQVQQRLVDHLDGGGGLLLIGKLPELDLEGRPCRILADALAVTAGEIVTESRHYYPSVAYRSLLAPNPETRVGWIQPLAADAGETLLVDVAGGRPCGLEISRGAGRAILLTAELPSNPRVFASVARRLGAEAGLSVRADVPGLLATTTATPDGERLLHLVNVTGYDTSVELSIDGQDLHDGVALVVPGHTGHLLPLGLRLPTTRVATVVWATAEITSVTPDSVAFGAGLGGHGGGPGTVVVLDTDAEITADAAHEVRRTGRRWTVSAPPGSQPVRLTIG
jgi:beta-galactosidase